MPDLAKAFEDMRGEGLIARLECYCACHGRDKAMEEARRQRGQPARGFVHVGEWDPALTLEELRVPLICGSTQGAEAEVGQIVARCLDGQGINYERDGRADRPIILLVGEDLDGLPNLPHRHDDLDLGNERMLRAPEYPEGAFDWVANNPVRLLNHATLRRMGINAPRSNGRLWHPRVGDQVKLGFHVRDAVAPEVSDLVKRVQLESMWVDVTGIEQTPDRQLYRGELVNAPLFIDPGRLRIGSPVLFTAEQVYPSPTSVRRRSSR